MACGASSGVKCLAVGLLAGLFVTAGVTESMAGRGYRLKRTSFSALPGWKDDHHAAAYDAFRRSCTQKLETNGFRRSHGLKAVCREVVKSGRQLSDRQARKFFERWFNPYLVVAHGSSKGLFTGYFEPEYSGTKTKTGKRQVPVLSAPENLTPVTRRVKGFPAALTAALQTGKGLKALPTRKGIENGKLDKLVRPIVWLDDPVDAFFLHIQGSGRIRLNEGGTVRLAFAGRNGHPYSSIGKKLLKTGILKKHELSMRSVQAWLRANPVKARKIMHANKSYIFFREIDLDEHLGPIGGQGVPLTAGRSLAIDRRYHRYGTPIWLDTRLPNADGSKYTRYRRMMIAQDTGAAIRGPIRGDIFFGTGPEAGEIAGRVKERGTLHVLLPKLKRKRR